MSKPAEFMHMQTHESGNLESLKVDTSDVASQSRDQWSYLKKGTFFCNNPQLTGGPWGNEAYCCVDRQLFVCVTCKQLIPLVLAGRGRERRGAKMEMM